MVRTAAGDRGLAVGGVAASLGAAGDLRARAWAIWEALASAVEAPARGRPRKRAGEGRERPPLGAGGPGLAPWPQGPEDVSGWTGPPSAACLSRVPHAGVGRTLGPAPPASPCASRRCPAPFLVVGVCWLPPRVAKGKSPPNSLAVQVCRRGPGVRADLSAPETTRSCPCSQTAAPGATLEQESLTGV